jgi:hypothetical protein
VNVKTTVKLTPQEVLAESEVFFLERRWKARKRSGDEIEFIFTRTTPGGAAKEFGWAIAGVLTFGFAEIFEPTRSSIPIVKVKARSRGTETEVNIEFTKRDAKMVSIEDFLNVLGSSKGVENSGEQDVSGKKRQTALILSVFLGILGFDRFYLGKNGTGILKLLTWGGFGIWWIADIITIASGKMTDSKGRLLVKN